MFTNLQVPRLRVLLVAGLIAATSLSGSQLANAQTTAASEWTWMGGSSTVPGAGEGYPGVYGTLGTPTAANIPGGRQGAAAWIDSGGHLWLFGGGGVAANDYGGALNDFWEFNPTTNEWTWMGGSGTVPKTDNDTGGQPGVYGTLGTPAAGNIPGGRYHASSWTDLSGNFWLFGGGGYDENDTSGYLNDLWKFNPSLGAYGEWVWMSGSNTQSCTTISSVTYCEIPGVYGALGTPVAGNTPGGRDGAAAWTDSSGNLWLFGGFGYDTGGTLGYLNDLWKFDSSLGVYGEWTWMGGSNTVPSSDKGQSGVYGTLKSPAAGNIPGGREYAVTWTDSSGNLWLFGGYGYDAGGTSGELNDLWEFDPSLGAYGEWTSMGGSTTVPCAGCGQLGTYGTMGTPASGNIPAGRESAVSWTDSSGDFWLFGGYDYYIGYSDNENCSNNYLYLNDLWEFNLSTNEWTWMSGSAPELTVLPYGYEASSCYTYSTATYGTLETPASGNTPGGREWAANWADRSGNFWLFGGEGSDAKSTFGYLSDLWEYQPSITRPTVTVTPSSSSITAAQPLTVTVAVSGEDGSPTPTGSVTLAGGGYTSTATALTGGSATIDVPALSLAVGSDTLTASYTPDSSSSATYSAATGIAAITVTLASQAITFTDNLPASAPYSAGLSYALSASGGGSGNPVTFSLISGPATVTGSTLAITGGGNVVVAANQIGNATYAAAPQVTQSILITQPAAP